MNALVLGDPTNTAVRGALKFACSARESFSLYCGRMPRIRASQFGGGLQVYNSGLRADLSACVFQDNACNWALGYNGQLTLTDGAWEAPANGNVFRVWTTPDGRKQYPRLKVRRHHVAAATPRIAAGAGGHNADTHRAFDELG